MKHRAGILLSLLLITHFVSAQYNPEKVDKKAVRLYSKAMELAQDEKLKEAIKTLQLAIQIDNKYEEAYLSLAGMFGQLKNYPAATDNFEKARDIDSIFFQDYNLSY